MNEEEFKKLKRELINRNNELVQKVQELKMDIAKQTSDNLDLTRTNNELRMQMSHMRHSHEELAKNMDDELQNAAEEALAYLVKASNSVTRVMEVTKSYLRRIQQLGASIPRWNFHSGTPTTERVHRVPPMMGGRSIQPVVLLNSASVNQTSPNSRQRAQSGPERTVPLRMLQDVYVPIRRIDIAEYMREQIQNGSVEDINNEESPNDTSNESSSRHALSVVTEATEEGSNTSNISRMDNPMEGPSWLLDMPMVMVQPKRKKKKSSRNYEPDSTTEMDESSAPAPSEANIETDVTSPAESARVFSPTVRKHKRATPPASNSSPDVCDNSRILQVLLPKLEASMFSTPPTECSTPTPSAPMPRDQPPPKKPKAGHSKGSPTESARESSMSSAEGGVRGRKRRSNSVASRASSEDEAPGQGRTRRARKPVEYKEVPLNRKMRR